jgi:hypothetical protein
MTVHNLIKLNISGYEDKIPAHTLGSLQRYVEHKLFPGGFLAAVLCNDLFGAVEHADSENQAALADIVKFVYNRMPNNSWGSKEVMYRFTEDAFYDRVKNAA